jgi:hypothetical protein
MFFFTSCWDLPSQRRVRYKIYVYFYLPALTIYAALQTWRRDNHALARFSYALSMVLSCGAIWSHCWFCARKRARRKEGIESESEGEVRGYVEAKEKGERLGEKDDGAGEDE